MLISSKQDAKFRINDTFPILKKTMYNCLGTRNKLFQDVLSSFCSGSQQLNDFYSAWCLGRTGQPWISSRRKWRQHVEAMFMYNASHRLAMQQQLMIEHWVISTGTASLLLHLILQLLPLIHVKRHQEKISSPQPPVQKTVAREESSRSANIKSKQWMQKQKRFLNVVDSLTQLLNQNDVSLLWNSCILLVLMSTSHS